MPTFLASLIEALLPLTFGLILSFKLLKNRGTKLFYAGPAILSFGVFLLFKPYIHEPSNSTVYKSSLAKLIKYEDIIGDWRNVLHVHENSLNKDLIYIFSFKPNGDCTLDYNSKDLALNMDSLYFYEMRCFIEGGRLFHEPRDGKSENTYRNSYDILSLTADTLITLDEKGRRQEFHKVK